MTEYDRHNPALAIGRAPTPYETEFNPIGKPVSQMTGQDVVKLFRCSDRQHWRTQLFKMLAERREIQRRQMAEMFLNSEIGLSRLEDQPRQSFSTR